MPSPSNLPLHFHRDRTERQLDARLEELLEKLAKIGPAEDPWVVRRAYEIAAERHRDQLRSSGDPYLTHLAGSRAHSGRYAAGRHHAHGRAAA